jgi:hypothetical protein
MKTTEITMKQRFNQRFPDSCDVWTFPRPNRLCCREADEIGRKSTSIYHAIEIPAELVEHIYSLGWNDAISSRVSNSL